MPCLISGSQFDSEGNLFDWWDNETKERFTERTKCIVDQYSSYEVPGIGLHINGLLTQGENIADNGGVKEAYKVRTYCCSWLAENISTELSSGFQYVFLSRGSHTLS